MIIIWMKWMREKRKINEEECEGFVKNEKKKEKVREDLEIEWMFFSYLFFFFFFFHHGRRLFWQISRPYPKARQCHIFMCNISWWRLFLLWCSGRSLLCLCIPATGLSRIRSCLWGHHKFGLQRNTGMSERATCWLRSNLPAPPCYLFSRDSPQTNSGVHQELHHEPSVPSIVQSSKFYGIPFYKTLPEVSFRVR